MDRHMLQEFVRDYAWIHLGIGIIGNILFVLGSLYFFDPGTRTLGTWLFLYGSLGMLLGRLGELVARGFDHHWRKLEAMKR